MSQTPLAKLENLTKDFVQGQTTVQVLKGIDLSVYHGDFTVIMGSSGSGKSTLLHILGCLDRPTTGTYILDGKPVDGLSDRRLSAIRNSYIGFVFQEFNLLPEATVYENIMLPFVYADLDISASRKRVLAAAEDVGLSNRLAHKPAALSGGERQRVAIARALAVRPRLILADEPTGNLDSQNSREILFLFEKLHRSGATIVLVTHDTEVARAARRTLFMRDGMLETP
ncbi:MAG: macrolide ABC transporter ATP-binding protein [Desulfobulbus sp.]|nr:MAG: macrolide ABC transporter ATP-binding protein [Desulfobulbus sp.]RUM40782.1 MAG: macrolide ABC transporter ATP-binding protein [Desulfobulbus sp.]